MSNKKIFVTGSAGFLGSHLVDKLSLMGHDVWGCDNLLGGNLLNVMNPTKFTNADCCDHRTMLEIMNESIMTMERPFDVVYHCAATAHKGLSVFSPSFITKNIFEASVSLFSAAIAGGVKRIVFCSSMERYGEQQHPFTEDMPTAPHDPYAVAKVAAEQVLKILGDVHGIEWNVAVPHSIIGPRQKYDDPYRNVLSIMLNRNLQNKPAVIYGDGEQVRCFSHVDDCTSCLVEMGLNPDIRSEIINIGPDEEHTSINELARICAEVTGFTGAPVYMPARPNDTKLATCSSDKARKLLGYKTTWKLKDAIRDTADYIIKSGPKSFKYTLPVEIVTDKTPKTWVERSL